MRDFLTFLAALAVMVCGLLVVFGSFGSIGG